MSVLSDKDRYELLKLLETQPELSQREIAKHLGISLGKVNFCLKALVDKGLVKARRFRKSTNKKAYLYVLTLKGIEEKSKVTVRFLARKQAEHRQLQEEIESLKAEAGKIRAGIAENSSKSVG